MDLAGRLPPRGGGERASPGGGAADADECNGRFPTQSPHRKRVSEISMATLARRSLPGARRCAPLCRGVGALGGAFVGMSGLAVCFFWYLRLLQDILLVLEAVVAWRCLLADTPPPAVAVATPTPTPAARGGDATAAPPPHAARGRRAAGPSGSSCHNGAVVTAVVEQEKEVAGGLGARPGSLAAAGTLAGTHRVGCLGVGRGVGCVLAASAGRTPRVPCRRDAGLVGVRVCWPLRPSLLATVLCPDPWGRAPGAVPFRARSGRSARAGRPLDGGCEPCRVRHRQRGGGSGRRRRPSDARSRQVARRSRCHPALAATGWPAARRAARVGRDAHKRRVVTAVAPVPYRWCSSHLVQTLALRVYRPDDGGGGTCRGQQSPVCAA